MSRPAFARAMASMPPFRTLMYAYVQPFSNRLWYPLRATVRTASSSGWRVGCL
jgi:hypothetical protein